jgi:hypothetical protein
MKKRTIALLIAAAISMPAMSGELGILKPIVKDNDALMRERPDGKGKAFVLEQVKQGKLYEALQQEAHSGFTRTMLALDDLAMQVAGEPKGQASWLMLALEDGGFARCGFWLQEGGKQRWLNECMVDLVVDQDSIADGSFEEIYAHEIGHVFLRRLLPNLPQGYSRTPHHSFSTADQQTALDEGFATHFQAIARRFTHNQRLLAQDAGIEYKPYTPLWLSNLDRAYRIEGVRQNWFVHQQVAAPGTEDAVARRELSTMFDRAQLKNPAQMLASEGFDATVFYRYTAAGEGGAALVRRYEPLFRAFKALNVQKLNVDIPLVPALAQALSGLSRADGDRFVQVLMDTSYGALASPQLAARAEALALPGRVGDGDTFVPALQAVRKEMAAQTAAAQAHPALLAEHIGPALWLLHPTLKALGGFQSDAPLAINLNTAEREHLMALPGIDAACADRLLAARKRDGAFASVSAFLMRAELGAADAQAIERMAAPRGPPALIRATRRHGSHEDRIATHTAAHRDPCAQIASLALPGPLAPPRHAGCDAAVVRCRQRGNRLAHLRPGWHGAEIPGRPAHGRDRWDLHRHHARD